MPETLKILLVGPSLGMSPFFAQRLRQQGYECSAAACYRDAEHLIHESTFDLVLSEMHLAEGSAHPLMARLEGSAATVFFRVDVHHGCWWLPALEFGRVVWGAPALRQEEFRRELERLLRSNGAPSKKSPRRADHLPSVLHKATA